MYTIYAIHEFISVGALMTLKDCEANLHDSTKGLFSS